METKTKIIALVVICVCSMLLLADNGFLQTAYAIGIVKTTVETTSLVPCVGYKPNYDITIVNDGTNTEFEFVNASSGATIHNTNVSVSCIGTTVSTTDIPANGVTCFPSGIYCLFSTQSSSRVALGYINLNDYSVTVFASNATYASCQFVSLVATTGSTAKGVMGACTNTALNGLYNVNFGLVTSGVTVIHQVFAQVDNTTPNSGLTSSCYDATTNKVALSYSSGSTGTLRTVTATNTVTAVTLGSDGDQVTCNGGYAITVGDGADKMVVTNLSTNAVSGTTTAVTNGHVALRHADTVFVSGSTTTVNLYQWKPTSAMTAIGTLTGFDINGSFQNGNSTRIEAIGITGTTVSHYVIWDLGNDGSESETPTGNQEFCDIPANANVLICRLEDNEGSISGASSLLNQSGTNIACQIGFLACTNNNDGTFTPDNPDITSNGVGYIMTAIAIGVFVGILWVASRGQLSEIPTFIWFIGTLAIVGAVTAIGWIDPTFLIVAIVAIAGFAVAKARGVFGGQSLFAGETG